MLAEAAALEEADAPELLELPELPEALVVSAEPVDDAADEPEVAPATALVVGSVAILIVVFLLTGTPVPELAAAPVMEPLAAAAATADEMVALSEERTELSEAGTTTGATPIAPVVLAGMLVVADEEEDMEEVAPPVRVNLPE